MLQRIMIFFVSASLFAFLIALLVLMWYVALPVMLILFAIIWWRTRQIRKIWEKVFVQMHTAAHSGEKKKPVIPPDVIEAEYTKL